jgi:hypothetical protein
MTHKFRFYRPEELDGLNPRQLEHLALVDQLLARDDFADIDPGELEQLPAAQLRHLLHGDSVGEPAKPEPKPVQRIDKPLIERVTPATLADAFVVKNGRLMRREVVRRTVAGFMGESVQFAPVGERVRFEGVIYRTSHLLHWLTTGEWVTRLPRAKATRYRGRVRVGGRVVHLGYFATEAERAEAVALAKLGIYPTGLKSA